MIAAASSSLLDIPWVPEAEWLKRTDPKRPHDEALNDPVWRIANLYYIKDEDGVIIPFRPRPEQRVIIWDIYVRGLRNILIPKARKLGMSTTVCICIADKIVWEQMQEAAIVDKTQVDAEKKLQEIIKLAIQKLDPQFRQYLRVPAGYDSKRVYGLYLDGTDEASKSWCSAAVTFRGGTPQFLLVSEWATIQFTNQNRSTEIKTGAMVAARHGVRIIETTWKGGKGGDVWAYVKMALQIPDHKKTPEDFVIRFFPWFVDPGNQRAGDYSQIDRETSLYLDQKETELEYKFTEKQRLWYYNEKQELGLFMKRENPTTLNECWEVPVPGAIYADKIEELRVARQITDVPYDPVYPVNTFWDLGSPQNTAVWYIQEIGSEVHVIDCDMGLTLTTKERVIHMAAKGYTYGTHFLPHDAAADQKGGITFQAELQGAGLENVRVVPRTNAIELGINAVRKLLPSCWFDSKLTETGVGALAAYRAKVDDYTGFRTELIVHDWASHPADALRVRAEAEEAGMLTKQGGRRFDHEGLKILNDKALPIQIQTGEVTVMNFGATFTATPGGWLQVFEKPQRARLYVIGYAAVEGRHVFAVGKMVHGEMDSDDDELTVVAALAGAGQIDPDVAAQYLKALATYYGTPPVTLVAENSKELESTAKLLRENGVPQIWMRPKLGSGKTSRVPGFEMGDEMTQPIAELARMIREQHLEAFPADARRQLHDFVKLPDGTEGAAPGAFQGWVRALAVMCHARAAASPYANTQERSLADRVLAPQPKHSSL